GGWADRRGTPGGANLYVKVTARGTGIPAFRPGGATRVSRSAGLPGTGGNPMAPSSPRPPEPRPEGGTPSGLRPGRSDPPAPPPPGVRRPPPRPDPTPPGPTRRW